MSAPAPTRKPRPVAAVRFGDILAAERIKIITLPAAWFAMAVASGAGTLLGIIAATDAVRIAGPGGPIPVARLGTLLLAPAYAFVSIAVFAAGSEYRGGQLRVSLAAAPDRNRLFAAKLTVSATLSLVASIPAVLPGYVLQHSAAVHAWERGAFVGFLALIAAYLLLSLIGHGFAVIAKSAITPLAVLFIAPFLISPALRSILPQVVRFLPHEAALSLLKLPVDPATALGPRAGLLVLAAWAAASVAAAWTVFVRAES
ncbi:hypothetical protein [Planotetraspora kaengkrachanensis]|uniref:Uncharacterized protein n=1 Tax=Planotetraspora kaengkrachanensis TaxID=575193 RepID=A0A8J3VC66_9ACTN|nr:hypothetical protein [Planotetraspora kaengkrachanensis]GIG84209.1 hypothetical protein Pka01_73360 [Planotetraspora kaengkrachanensis]